MSKAERELEEALDSIEGAVAILSTQMETEITVMAEGIQELRAAMRAASGALDPSLGPIQPACLSRARTILLKAIDGEPWRDVYQ